jgi:hypothetical protein
MHRCQQRFGSGALRVRGQNQQDELQTWLVLENGSPRIRALSIGGASRS